MTPLRRSTLVDWLVSRGFVERTTGAGLRVLRRVDAPEVTITFA